MSGKWAYLLPVLFKFLKNLCVSRIKNNLIPISTRVYSLKENKKISNRKLKF